MTGLLVEKDPNAENAPVEDPRETLVGRAAAFGVRLEAAAAAAMLSYLDLLLAKNEQINLTAVRDRAEAVERHLLDSLAFGLHAAGTARPRVLVDLGSGGGFPGVPIAIAWPDCEVHLVDSTRKKIDAVRDLAGAAGIPNLAFHWGRGEELGRGGGPLAARADTVVARAVGTLAEIVRASCGLLAPGGHLVAWKSEVADAERAAGLQSAAAARMESLPDIEYELDRRRRLVRYRRLR
jgi:16S rRNA (guanine527-N7)-methyltransferase